MPITTTLALTNQVGKMRGKKEALEKGTHTEIEGDGILDYSSEKKGKHIGKFLCRVEKVRY